MALPKKSSRRITVGEESYLWMIRDNDDHYILAIQLESGSGQKLVVTFSGGGWRVGMATLVVTPKDVSAIICEGQLMGWAPNETGNPQTFNIRNGDALLEELSNKE